MNRPIEVWANVVGYEGIYHVSDLGNIRRIAKIRKILKPDTNGGYARIHLCHLGKSKRMSVHRLVVEAFIGRIPVGMEVNHKNGIKSDNRVCNLEIVTSSENKQHSIDVLKRPLPIGSRHGLSKLDESQVINIRELHNIGCSGRELAERYEVSQSTISMVVKRKIWRHI